MLLFNRCHSPNLSFVPANLLLLLLFLTVGETGFAQVSLRKPAELGGNPAKTIDFSNPAAGTVRPSAFRDFVKFNPSYRSLLPKSRQCATVEMEEDRRHETATETVAEFEQWIERSIEQVGTRSLMRKGAATYSIPVVVHVIYSNETENIKDEQIFSQIEALNQDFRRTNADKANTAQTFDALASDTQIEFCLAQKSPQGGATNGIDRISIAGGPFTDRYINDVIKPNTLWDPNRYLNIWVCNLSGGILGYAQFPSSAGVTGLPTDPGGVNTDGVVIHYTAFGTLGTAAAPFSKGRTATHEVGHWLGLRHIWGDGDCSADDFCDDTPRTAAPNFMCPTGATGCNGVAMFQNYMDYTDDACMNLFTRDQRARMRAVLENSPRRRTLTQSTACVAPVSAPQPEFVANITSGCSPLEVQFRNLSQGNFEQIEWSFEGGRPASSKKADPLVSYRQSGIYPVRLTLTNRQGPGTTTRQGYIQVIGKGQAPPLAIDFEANDFPENILERINPDRDLTWERSARVGGHGKSNGAAWFNNFNNNLVGGTDALLLPISDLSGSIATQLRFDVAYAPYTDERYTDTLAVFIATDCDARFQAIYYKGGNQLATAAGYRSNFVPQSGEWRTEAIDLSAFDGAAYVRIAFVNLSGYGNDLYLDNIRLDAQPNPRPIAAFTFSDSVICSGESVSFQDASDNRPGKWVWSFPGGFPASDTTREPTISYPEPGVYDVVLTVSNAHGTATTRQTGRIEVMPGPEVDIVASAQRLCPGNEARLTARGASAYEWIRVSGPEARDSVLLVRPQASTTYLVAGFAENGCRTVTATTVTVGESNPLQIDPPAAKICAGEEVRLTAFGSGNYTWTDLNDSTQTMGNVLVARPQRSTVFRLSGTTNTGCPVSRDAHVTVGEKPENLSLSLTDTTICPGEAVPLKAGGAAAYTWLPFEDLDHYQGASVVARPLRSTTYTLRAETASGCVAERQVRIQVKDGPQLRVTPPAPAICSGDRIELIASGAREYQWSPAAGLNATFGTLVQAAPATRTRYQIIGSNGTGCLDTAYVDLRVVPSPQVEVFTSHSALCPGEQALLRAYGGAEYRWSPQQGLNTTTGPEVLARPQVNTTYQVLVRGDNGCVSQGNIRVDVATAGYPRPGFIAEKTNICAGEQVSFTDISENARAYRWTFPGAVPASSTERNPTVTYFAPGVYDVLLDVQGCEGADRVTRRGYIRVSQSADVQLAFADTLICPGDSVQLVASGAFRYEWSPAPGLDRTEGPVVMARPAQSTIYTVRGANEMGCSTTREVIVSLKSSAGLLAVSPAEATYCAGGSVVLRATGGDSLRWTPAAGLSTDRGWEVFASPLETTVYQVSSLDAGGCAQSQTVRVTVHPRPAVSINADSVEICYGGMTSLIASGAGAYTWSPAAGLSASAGNEVEAFPRFSTTYLVSGTDENGCSGEARVQVRVRTAEEFTVSASADTICRGQSVLLSVKGGNGPFYWSPAENVEAATGPQVRALPRVTTTYTVSSGPDAGCENTATYTVHVTESEPIRIDPLAPTICPGGEVTLRATGALEYAWAAAPGLADSSGAIVTVRPAATTAYSVSGYDSLGCQVAGTVSVQVKAQGTLELAASAGSVCDGDLVTLSARGASSYRWVSGNGLNQFEGENMYVQPNESSTFRVISEDDFGCRDTAAVEVKVARLAPDFRLSQTKIDLADGPGIIGFEDQTPGAIAWQWELGTGATSTASNPRHIFTEVGTHTVRLMVSNGVCRATTTSQVLVVNSSSLEELASENRIQVTARAVAGMVDLRVNSPRNMFLRLRLLDSAGNHVLAGAVRIPEGNYAQQLDLNGYEKGKYFLQLTDGVETFSQQIEYN